MGRKKQLFSSKFWNSLNSKTTGEHLYAITDGEKVKIGRSNDPEKRLKQLQTGSPLRLFIFRIFRGKGFRERELHHKLADKKINNEWFSMDDETSKTINDFNKEE